MPPVWSMVAGQERDFALGPVRAWVSYKPSNEVVRRGQMLVCGEPRTTEDSTNQSSRRCRGVQGRFQIFTVVRLAGARRTRGNVRPSPDARRPSYPVE